jgi:hypothetical protein
MVLITLAIGSFARRDYIMLDHTARKDYIMLDHTARKDYIMLDHTARKDCIMVDYTARKDCSMVDQLLAEMVGYYYHCVWQRCYEECSLGFWCV